MVKRLVAIAWVLLVALGGLPEALAQDRPRVTVFEAWFIHNESMGAPTAVAKGFFEGLEVKVVGGGPGLSPIDRVMAETKRGEIALGVDYPYNVLEAREKQKLPLVVVAHDFQKSAVRLISWKEIKSPKDIQGTVATWIGYDKQVKAAIGPEWSKQIRIVNQQGDPATIGSWLKKDYPIAHAMIYNEILVAKRMAREKYWEYAYTDFGIDWPENVVFTTEEVIRKHPKAVQAFVTGRYQGYKYALGHRHEAVKILLQSNSNLRGQEPHELVGMEAIATVMVTDDTKKHGLGYIDPAGWERVGRDLTRAGIFPAVPNVKAAYTVEFKSGVMP
jgi:NitT/TauT family transport system substrate-binding protein